MLLLLLLLQKAIDSNWLCSHRDFPGPTASPSAPPGPQRSTSFLGLKELGAAAAFGAEALSTWVSAAIASEPPVQGPAIGVSQQFTLAPNCAVMPTWLVSVPFLSLQCVHCFDCCITCSVRVCTSQVVIANCIVHCRILVSCVCLLCVYSVPLVFCRFSFLPCAFSAFVYNSGSATPLHVDIRDSSLQGRRGSLQRLHGGFSVRWLLKQNTAARRLCGFATAAPPQFPGSATTRPRGSAAAAAAAAGG